MNVPTLLAMVLLSMMSLVSAQSPKQLGARWGGNRNSIIADEALQGGTPDVPLYINQLTNPPPELRSRDNWIATDEDIDPRAMPPGEKFYYDKCIRLAGQQLAALTAQCMKQDGCNKVWYRLIMPFGIVTGMDWNKDFTLVSSCGIVKLTDYGDPNDFGFDLVKDYGAHILDGVAKRVGDPAGGIQFVAQQIVKYNRANNCNVTPPIEHLQSNFGDASTKHHVFAVRT